MKRYLLSIILVLYSSSAPAFPPGIDAVVASGGSVASSCPGGALYCDNFNRANENPIGNPWVQAGGFSGQLKLVDETRITSTFDGHAASIYDAIFSNDQYSQIKITTEYGGTRKGVLVRASKTVQTAYSCRWNGLEIQLLKWSSGSMDLLNACTTSITVPATLKCEVAGSSTTTLVAKINGTQVCTHSDSSSPISSGYPGAYFEGLNDVLDDWEGGNL